MRFIQCMLMRNGAHFYEEAHLKTLRLHGKCKRTDGD